MGTVPGGVSRGAQQMLKTHFAYECRVAEGYDFTVRASLMAQTVKNLPAMQEGWVQSLGQEDPLEKGMATHSSILTWRIP